MIYARTRTNRGRAAPTSHFSFVLEMKIWEYWTAQGEETRCLSLHIPYCNLYLISVSVI